MRLDLVQDHLEAMIAPVRVREIWTTPTGITAEVPALIADEKQSTIAIATGARRVGLVRYPDCTFVFLVFGVSKTEIEHPCTRVYGHL